MSSEDEDDPVPSDEEGEHTVLNLFLEVVGQGRSGRLVESLLDDEELARTALWLSSFVGCPVPGDAGCLAV